MRIVLAVLVAWVFASCAHAGPISGFPVASPIFAGDAAIGTQAAGGATVQITAGNIATYATPISASTWFTGGSYAVKITAACASFSGAQGTIAIPAGQTSGVVPPVTDNCPILDLRATSETAGWGNVLSGFEFYQRNTANYVGGENARGAITVHDDDYAGGVNSYPSKSQSQDIFALYDGRDVGEHHGFLNSTVYCQGSGDCLGSMFIMQDYGGYGTGGDEGQEGLRIWNNVGAVNDATGGVPTNASITVSGTTIGGTWVNPHALGVRNAPLMVTSRGTYSTGTLASAAVVSTVCHVTGSGTTWTSLGSGATSTLFLRIKQFEAGTPKFVVPITAINSDTDLSISFNENVTNATCPTNISGSNYVIYLGSPLTALGAPASGTQDPGTVIVASGTPFLAGDVVEQPIDYNVKMTGVFITQNSPFSSGGDHTGVEIYNTGPAQLGEGIVVEGATGGYGIGLEFRDAITTLISASTAPIFFADNDTTLASNQVLLYLNSSGATRSLIYDRTNDRWALSGGQYFSAVDSRISIGATLQAGVLDYQNLNSATGTGLVVENGTAPNVGVPLISTQVAGVPRFEQDNLVSLFNDGDILRGYSDNQATQTWGISSATGNINGTTFSVGAPGSAVAGVSCAAGTVNLTTEVVTNGIVTHC